MLSMFIKSRAPLKVQFHEVQKPSKPGSRDPAIIGDDAWHPPTFEEVLEDLYQDTTYEHDEINDTYWADKMQQQKVERARAQEQFKASQRRARWLQFCRWHFNEIKGLDFQTKWQLYQCWLAENRKISERRCRRAWELRQLLSSL